MRILLLVLCAAAMSLASCITVGAPVSTTATPGFVTATLRPTHTAYAGSPTASTKAAATEGTPAATASANCKDVAVLVQDVTIADGTNVAYGAKFTKTWQFSNSGTCAWHGYTIAFISGDRMASPDTAPVDDTAPKSTVNVSVDLIAPTSDGIYTGVFELRNAVGKPLAIGTEKTFWVKIAVGDATVPTVAQQPTGAIPTITGTLTTPKAPLSCKYVISGSYPNEIATLINKARTEAGLAALTVDSQLTSAAQAHSIDMACFGLLSHSGSNGSTIQQRASAAGYAGLVMELIYESGYPDDAVKWWLNDPTHADIIYSKTLTNIGVGYAYTSDHGGYYTVDEGQ